MTQAKRPRRIASEKTAMMEVRVSPEEKSRFLTACFEMGVSASTVIRSAMRTEVRRAQERPGRRKMLMTVLAMMPVFAMSGASELRLGMGDGATASTRHHPAACEDAIVRKAPIWPMGADGRGLSVPEGGIRIIVSFDLDDTLQPINVRSRGPVGSDAFTTASVAALMDWCFPAQTQRTGLEHAFDFQLSAADE